MKCKLVLLSQWERLLCCGNYVCRLDVVNERPFPELLPWSKQFINQNTIETNVETVWKTVFKYEKLFRAQSCRRKWMFDVKNAFCSQLFTACQSSTDRKGGQAVPSLCNQCWGFCGGPTAIPDYSQNVRTSYCSVVNRVEEVVVSVFYSEDRKHQHIVKKMKWCWYSRILFHLLLAYLTWKVFTSRSESTCGKPTWTRHACISFQKETWSERDLRAVRHGSK